jgi:hypothetical protein
MYIGSRSDLVDKIKIQFHFISFSFHNRAVAAGEEEEEKKEERLAEESR